MYRYSGGRVDGLNARLSAAEAQSWLSLHKRSRCALSQLVAGQRRDRPAQSEDGEGDSENPVRAHFRRYGGEGLVLRGMELAGG